MADQRTTDLPAEDGETENPSAAFEVEEKGAKFDEPFITSVSGPRLLSCTIQGSTYQLFCEWEFLIALETFFKGWKNPPTPF